jgi:hypothetical protein
MLTGAWRDRPAKPLTHWAGGRGAIVGYVILESDDTLRLAAEVNQYLAKGWKPLGGVSCYYISSNQSVRYVQAVVREPAGQADLSAAVQAAPGAADERIKVKSRLRDDRQ